MALVANLYRFRIRKSDARKTCAHATPNGWFMHLTKGPGLHRQGRGPECPARLAHCLFLASFFVVLCCSLLYRALWVAGYTFAAGAAEFGPSGVKYSNASWSENLLPPNATLQNMESSMPPRGCTGVAGRRLAGKKRPFSKAMQRAQLRHCLNPNSFHSFRDLLERKSQR